MQQFEARRKSIRHEIPRIPEKLSIYFRHSQTGSTTGVDVGCRWEWKILIQTEVIRNSHRNTRHIKFGKVKAMLSRDFRSVSELLLFLDRKTWFLNHFDRLLCERRRIYIETRRKREKNIKNFMCFFALLCCCYVRCVYIVYYFLVRVSCCCWRVSFLLTRTRR